MPVLLFNILYPFIMTLLVTIPLSILSDIKKPKLSRTFFVTCYLLITLLIYQNKTDFGMPIQLGLSFVYIYFNSKNITNSVITPLIVFVLIVMSDTLSGLFFVKFLNFSYTDTKTNLNLYFIVGMTILLLTITTSKLIQKVYLNTIIKNFTFKKTSNYNSVLLYTTISIFIILVSYLTMFRFILHFVDENYFVLYSLSVIFFLIIFLIIICLAIRYVKLLIKQDFIDKENKQLKDYSNMLENMSTDLRRFKHDYINILSTLGEFINQGDIVSLKDYYRKELLPESTQIINKDKHISLLKNLKITPLKALISSKIIYAQSKGIEIRVEILDEIDKLPIRTLDICRIIGIFLDNAIEATLLCDKKFIHLAIIQNDNNIIIAILNSCSQDTPPVYVIYGKDFSTKGENRGIGLKSVKDMLNQNYKNILLNTTINNCIFKQEMIMNKSDN